MREINWLLLCEENLILFIGRNDSAVFNGQTILHDSKVKLWDSNCYFLGLESGVDIQGDEYCNLFTLSGVIMRGNQAQSVLILSYFKGFIAIAKGLIRVINAGFDAKKCMGFGIGSQGHLVSRSENHVPVMSTYTFLQSGKKTKKTFGFLRTKTRACRMKAYGGNIQ